MDIKDFKKLTLDGMEIMNCKVVKIWDGVAMFEFEGGKTRIYPLHSINQIVIEK